MEQVSVQELALKARSKNEVYRLLSTECKSPCPGPDKFVPLVSHLGIGNVYLPKKQRCTHTYFMQILTGEKKVRPPDPHRYHSTSSTRTSSG